MKGGALDGRMPAKVFVSVRPIVTAGFAKPVDAVRRIRDEIGDRVRALLADLGITTS